MDYTGLAGFQVKYNSGSIKTTNLLKGPGPGGFTIILNCPGFKTGKGELSTFRFPAQCHLQFLFDGFVRRAQ